jgi:hypothetical protein
MAADDTRQATVTIGHHDVLGFEVLEPVDVFVFRSTI